MQVGGHSDEKTGSADAQGVADAVRSEIESQAGSTFSEYTVKKFTTQVVNGLNYKLKIKTGDDQYLHAKVYKPLPYTGKQPELKEVQTGKSETDAL